MQLAGVSSYDAEQDREGLAMNLITNRQITILVTNHIPDNNIPEGTSTIFKAIASHVDFLESQSPASLYKPK